jgi:hypothetical protein
MHVNQYSVMGAKSGVLKVFRRLYGNITAEKLAAALLLIDGSYVLHSVTRLSNLGYD